MPSFLDRYNSGEEEDVWSDMVALGESVREERHYSDALAVARETMKRLRRNLRLIHRRLSKAGFDFAKPEEVFIPAQKGAKSQLRAVEAELGTMPLSLRAFYEHIHCAKFYGTHRQYNSEDSVFRRMYDGLYIPTLKEAYGRREVEPNLPDYDPRQNGRIGIPLWVATNCETAQILLPEQGADQWFYNNGYGDMYFVQHLRFFGGGFAQFTCHKTEMQSDEELPEDDEYLDDEVSVIHLHEKLYTGLTSGITPI